MNSRVLSSREKFLAACGGQSLDRPPVWLMRQAGRYLPEYREIRSRHTFWEMIRTPDLATEVTLQPVRRYGMDAAILFSDILVVLDAMGAKVHFETGGPQVQHLVQNSRDLSFLRSLQCLQDFSYIGEALQRICSILHPHTAVIGFAGAPFTLAAYLICGGPSKNIDQLRVLATRDLALYEEIANWISDVVIELLLLQIRAGADVVQLFDTWSFHLTPDEYQKLALPYSRRVLQRVALTKIPTILYIRNAEQLFGHAIESECSVLSIDTSLDLKQAQAHLPPGMPLQGNFDPRIFNAPALQIRQEVQKTLRKMQGTAYIVNVGQGLTPDTSVDGVAAFIEAVRGDGR